MSILLVINTGLALRVDILTSSKHHNNGLISVSLTYKVIGEQSVYTFETVPKLYHRNSSKHCLCNMKTKKENKERRSGRRKQMEGRSFLQDVCMYV
jgi:hypothetical protein